MIMTGHDAESEGSATPPTSTSLTERLDAVAVPLTEAFAARYQVIAPRGHVAVAPAVLMANLLHCVAAGDDVDAIVKLARSLAAEHGHAAGIVGAYRDAVQALDWAIRDLQLEQYSRVEREQFATSTALFIELVRRAMGDAAERVRISRNSDSIS